MGLSKLLAVWGLTLTDFPGYVVGQVTEAADHVPHLLAAGHSNGALLCLASRATCKFMHLCVILTTKWA